MSYIGLVTGLYKYCGLLDTEGALRDGKKFLPCLFVAELRH